MYVPYHNVLGGLRRKWMLLFPACLVARVPPPHGRLLSRILISVPPAPFSTTHPLESYAAVHRASGQAYLQR